MRLNILPDEINLLYIENNTHIGGLIDEYLKAFRHTKFNVTYKETLKDGLEFLRGLPDNSAVGVLFDPPYSEEQCLRIYTPKFRGTAGRAEYWAKCKDEIARITENGGIVISCCWDSTGMGKRRGFEIIEVLLVCHGACHNDTIVTVEQKVSSKLC